MILFAAIHQIKGQTGSTAAPEAPYLRFPNVPPFKILKVDSSTYFTKDDLKKHKYTMVMFFSPTCDQGGGNINVNQAKAVLLFLPRGFNVRCKIHFVNVFIAFAALAFSYSNRDLEQFTIRSHFLS